MKTYHLTTKTRLSWAACNANS